MADEVAIRGTDNTAKLRNPLGVIGLSLITLGIYGAFWWYFINREMADLGSATQTPELGDSPGLSVIAMTLGSLVLIPPFVTLWRTCKRIETSQNRVLGSNNFSPILAFLLVLPGITAFVTLFLMQSNLNQVWRQQG